MEALLRCHQTEILAMKGELADKEKRIGVLESIVIVLAKECGFRLEHIGMAQAPRSRTHDSGLQHS